MDIYHSHVEENKISKKSTPKLNGLTRDQSAQLHGSFKKSKTELLLTETLLPNNNATYGPVIDRYLPVQQTDPDMKFYHHHDNLLTKSAVSNEYNIDIDPTSSLIARIASNIPLPITDHVQVSPERMVDPRVHTSISGNSSGGRNVRNKLSLQVNNQTSIASALGFTSQRIYHFKPSKSPKKLKCLYNLFEIFSLSGVSRNESNASTVFETVSEIAFKVLDAPGLRNDYYSNLVCWANKTDMIAVGLGSIVYCWSEKKGTTALQSFGSETISALSYSSDDFLAVGTQSSKVYLYGPGSVDLLELFELNSSASICSIKWMPKSKYLLIGNDIGEVTLLRLIIKEGTHREDSPGHINYPSYSLRCVVTFKCDLQQVCGIDINPSGKQLAIGVNSNCSSIWDISNLSAPKKLFHLKHEAAVKAVAFCPWMPNLLATGGGSKDKNIRFWHSTSGTLVSKHQMKGQITAIVWSRSKREILITFGFGESAEKNNILAVYDYPSMKMKKVVNAPPDMRILTADISNDFTSVCASISDQSVRIYNVWSSKYDIRSGFNHDSLYGSDIIDSEEGIDKSLGLIR